MTKPILISGIQPTGKLHLGNYLGALKNFVDLQNSGKYQCYFFVADYHSLTEDFNPQEKTKQIENLTADFLAAGLDPKKSIIFLQSQVSQSTELAWIFETLAPLGELARMTQFKDKMSNVPMSAMSVAKEKMKQFKLPEKITRKEELFRFGGDTNTGLLTYPVLMAADILLYAAQFVPVGEDQLQHLELTRTLARKFNSKFGQTFVEPKSLMTAVPRLMSLDDPSKKMSKSRPAGCLFIDDSPEEIERKVKVAVTDSGNEIKYDPKNKAGVSNLLSLVAGLSRKPVADVEKGFSGMNYAEFKHSTSDYISDYFALFRKKKSALLKKPTMLKKVLRHGSGQAAKIAQKKIEEVKEKIGLVI